MRDSQVEQRNTNRNNRIFSINKNLKKLFYGWFHLLKHTYILIFLAILLTFSFHKSYLLPSFFNDWFWMGLTSVKRAILFFSFWYCLLILVCKYRTVAWIILPIVIIPNIVLIWANHVYGAAPFATILAALDTTWKESSEYLTLKNISAFLLANICLSVIIYSLRKYIGSRLISYYGKHLTSLLCSLVVLGVFFSGPLYIITHYNQKSPLQWRDFIIRNHPVMSMSVALDLFDFYRARDLPDPALTPSSLSSSPLPDAIVLYIGESFRADHNPFNGYKRNTLPRISSTKNIINLPLVYSKATSTLLSIQSLLTITGERSLAPQSKSFISILKKHGYERFLLVSDCTSGCWYESPIIKSALDDNIQLYSRPENAIAYSNDVKHLVSKHTNIFLLIEDGTGHSPYESDFEVFGNKSIIDKYDNCILEIDTRVMAIINELKNKDALLLFISDHGESFGEGGRIGHGGIPEIAPEQVHVSCFIWFSDLYAQRRPEIIETLKANANKMTYHNFVYHTIISLSGIHSEIQNKELDLTQKITH